MCRKRTRPGRASIQRCAFAGDSHNSAKNAAQLSLRACLFAWSHRACAAVDAHDHAFSHSHSVACIAVLTSARCVLSICVCVRRCGASLTPWMRRSAQSVRRAPSCRARKALPPTNVAGRQPQQGRTGSLAELRLSRSAGGLAVAQQGPLQPCMRVCGHSVCFAKVVAHCCAVCLVGVCKHSVHGGVPAGIFGVSLSLREGT